MAETILRLLAEWTLRATLLAAAVGALLWMLRIKDASLRSAAWTLVLVGNLLIPVLYRTVPQASILLPVVLREPGALHDSNVRPASVRETELDAVSRPADLEHQAPSVPPPTPQRNWAQLVYFALVGMWSAVAIFMLFRLSVGLWLSHRLLRLSKEVSVGLRVSSQVAVPVTVGVLRPVILVPPDWRQWEKRQREAVLAHEGAHVERRDPLRQLMAGIYRSLCWFHPLSWWLYARLATLAEAACDDAALATIKDREFYADLLLAFLTRAPGRVRWEGVTMARNAKIMKRMERILDPRRKLSGSLARSASFAVIIAAMPLIYIAASARPVWANSQAISTSTSSLVPKVSGSATPTKRATSPSPAVALSSRRSPAIPVSVHTVALPPDTAPDDEHFVLNVSDGEDTFTERIGTPTDKGGVYATHFRRLQELGIAKKPFPRTDEFANFLRTEVWREGGLVKVQLWVAMSKLRKRELGPEWAVDSRFELIGHYSIPSENEPLVLRDLAPYGMPMLRLQLVRKLAACPTPTEELGNLTTSLRAEGLQPEGGNCFWVLRNVSAKTIVMVETGYAGVDGANTSNHPTGYYGGGPPGTTIRVGPVPVTRKGAALTVQGHASVLLCVFDDGTYEGDERSAMVYFGGLAGTKFVIAQFVSYARELLPRADSEAEFLESAKAKYRDLPDADSGLEGEEIARLKPQDAAHLRMWIRAGIEAGKRNISFELDEHTIQEGRQFRNVPFREHWNAVLSSLVRASRY